MWAICDKLRNDSVEMWVDPFAPRPVIHHRDRSSGERPKAWTFTDAIERFGGRVGQEDFHWAYRTTRGIFDKELEQTFIVLKKENSKKIVQEMQEGRVGGARALANIPKTGWVASPATGTRGGNGAGGRGGRGGWRGRGKEKGRGG